MRGQDDHREVARRRSRTGCQAVCAAIGDQALRLLDFVVIPGLVQVPDFFPALTDADEHQSTRKRAEVHIPGDLEPVRKVMNPQNWVGESRPKVLNFKP